MITSACQIFDCANCDHLAAARCPGCFEGNVRLEKRGIETCAVYRCAVEQNIESCTDCKEPSCRYSRSSDLVCPLRSRLENRRWWAGKLARGLTEHDSAPERVDIDKISDRTIERMRWYLMALDSFVSQGMDSASSWQLAQRVGVKAPLIRKDLSRFGEFGTPSFGYDVKYLRRKILDILHLDENHHVVWLGAQKFREQVGVISRLSEHNCQIVAVLDPDPSEVGKKIADVQVLHLDNLPHVLHNLSADLAVVALPPVEAQKAATLLSRAGVIAILNMSSSLLVVPEHVTVRNVDLGGELLALSYYCCKNKSESDTDKKSARRPRTRTADA